MEDGGSPSGGRSKGLGRRFSDFVDRVRGKNPDDVTEEIISMVNEGHEQGVLQANEAEMIHNIFEFADMEAKDIMIHRRHVVAVDGDMKLSDALEYMLEQSYSRFPVYKNSIDNIIGIVHIKDAMIQSRNEAVVGNSLCEVPGLVREAKFIPETRNISDLFQKMQSQKNHMVIVVDEYGQTAGIVAMEDILEEIVGNILDEYDEEETMITKQGEGCFLIQGMAPLEEVCQELNFQCDLEDYDTLNGYLISLIDKIPGDDEVFQVEDNGYLFQVLSVKNKMIQTVRATAITNRQEEPKASTCQENQSVVE